MARLVAEDRVRARREGGHREHEAVPGGNELATTGADGNVRLWDACLACLSPRLLLARARRVTVRCLTALERRVYLHERVTRDEPCAA